MARRRGAISSGSIPLSSCTTHNWLAAAQHSTAAAAARAHAPHEPRKRLPRDDVPPRRLVDGEALVRHAIVVAVACGWARAAAAAVPAAFGGGVDKVGGAASACRRHTAPSSPPCSALALTCCKASCLLLAALPGCCPSELGLLAQQQGPGGLRTGASGRSGPRHAAVCELRCLEGRQTLAHSLPGSQLQGFVAPGFGKRCRGDARCVKRLVCLCRPALDFVCTTCRTPCLLTRPRAGSAIQHTQCAPHISQASPSLHLSQLQHLCQSTCLLCCVLLVPCGWQRWQTRRSTTSSWA